MISKLRAIIKIHFLWDQIYLNQENIEEQYFNSNNLLHKNLTLCFLIPSSYVQIYLGFISNYIYSFFLKNIQALNVLNCSFLSIYLIIAMENQVLYILVSFHIFLLVFDFQFQENYYFSKNL